jgi:hypothetical protein
MRAPDGPKSTAIRGLRQSSPLSSTEVSATASKWTNKVGAVLRQRNSRRTKPCTNDADDTGYTVLRIECRGIGRQEVRKASLPSLGWRERAWILGKSLAATCVGWASRRLIRACAPRRQESRAPSAAASGLPSSSPQSLRPSVIFAHGVVMGWTPPRRHRCAKVAR